MEYALLFQLFTGTTEIVVPFAGVENTIPIALYSCPPLKIPIVPLTPIVLG
jgi:hypothetical protein